MFTLLNFSEKTSVAYLTGVHPVKSESHLTGVQPACRSEAKIPISGPEKNVDPDIGTQWNVYRACPVEPGTLWVFNWG